MSNRDIPRILTELWRQYPEYEFIARLRDKRLRESESKFILWKLKWKQFTPNIEPLNIAIDFAPYVVEPNTEIIVKKINEIINHLYTK